MLLWIREKDKADNNNKEKIRQQNMKLHSMCIPMCIYADDIAFVAFLPETCPRPLADRPA